MLKYGMDTINETLMMGEGNKRRLGAPYQYPIVNRWRMNRGFSTSSIIAMA